MNTKHEVGTTVVERPGRGMEVRPGAIERPAERAGPHALAPEPVVPRAGAPPPDSPHHACAGRLRGIRERLARLRLGDRLRAAGALGCRPVFEWFRVSDPVATLVAWLAVATIPLAFVFLVFWTQFAQAAVLEEPGPLLSAGGSEVAALPPVESETPPPAGERRGGPPPARSKPSVGTGSKPRQAAGHSVPPATSAASWLRAVCPIVDVPVPIEADLLVGAPRIYRGIRARHLSVDFYASHGTPVHAALGGYVVQATHDYVELSEAFRNLMLDEAAALGDTPDSIYRLLVGRNLVVDCGIINGHHVVMAYNHLSWIRPDLTVGTRVSTGEVIARVGNSGTSSASAGTLEDSHLDFTILVDGKPLGLGMGVGAQVEMFDRILRPLTPTPPRTQPNPEAIPLPPPAVPRMVSLPQIDPPPPAGASGAASRPKAPAPRPAVAEKKTPSAAAPSPKPVTSAPVAKKEAASPPPPPKSPAPAASPPSPASPETTPKLEKGTPAPASPPKDTPSTGGAAASGKAGASLEKVETEAIPPPPPPPPPPQPPAPAPVQSDNPDGSHEM